MAATNHPHAVAALERLASGASWRDEARLAVEIPALWERLPEGSPLRTRLAKLREALEARAEERFAVERARVRGGQLRGAELATWLAAMPAEQRDVATEQLLGIAHRPLPVSALGADLVNYVASGVSAIVRAALDVPVLAHDRVVDLGAGLGKVAMLLELLTGASARGIELQPELARHAAACAQGLGLEATFEAADARTADLAGATVVFLYLPFTGASLDAAMERVRAAAQQRALVVCSLGLDLGRYTWLAPRETEAFWLTVYDTSIDGAAPGLRRGPSLLPPLAQRLATEL